MLHACYFYWNLYINKLCNSNVTLHIGFIYLSLGGSPIQFKWGFRVQLFNLSFTPSYYIHSCNIHLTLVCYSKLFQSLNLEENIHIIASFTCVNRFIELLGQNAYISFPKSWSTKKKWKTFNKKDTVISFWLKNKINKGIIIYVLFNTSNK